MLTFDSVKLRLEREQSLSYMEFNYMIQAATLQLLNKKIVFYKLDWFWPMGNILNGVELIEKFKEEAFGLTTPLITTVPRKNGKTEKEQFG